MKTKHLSCGKGMRFSHVLTAMLTLLVLLLPSQAKADNEAWAEYDNNTKTLTFKYGEKPTSFDEGVTAYALKGIEDLDTSNIESYFPAWYNDRGSVTTAVFDKSFADARPTCCFWFIEMKNLTSIKGMEYLNTSEVTTMMSMFYDCSKLTEIDLSHFNTSKVTNMQSMFSGCSSLTKIDLSNFNTSEVTTMGYMFSGCHSLTEVNLSNLNTSKVTDMQAMFCASDKLETLDLSNFETSSVTMMDQMFSTCTNLKSITFSSKFKTSNVTNMESMFCSCKNLTSLDLSSFNTENVTDMSAMFGWCPCLTSLDLSMFNTAKVTDMGDMFMGSTTLATIYVSSLFVVSSSAVSEDMFKACSALKGAVSYDANMVDAAMANYKTGYFTSKIEAWAEYDSNTKTLTFKYGEKPTSFDEGVTAYALNEGDNEPAWIDYEGSNSICGSATTVKFDDTFATARPTSCYAWFVEMENLTTIEGLKNLNTSETTNLGIMFYGCKSLTEIDLSNFNTQAVTSLMGMFAECKGLTEIDLSSFNTSAVTDMQALFSGCINLKSVKLSNFDTSKVKDMQYMFNECRYLTEFDLSKFDTSKVTQMNYMFCSSGFESLDLSNFNTSAVTNMSYMFSSCASLKSITFSSKFTTSTVTNMESMFSGCKSLTSLDLSSFNTENVTDMSAMFGWCPCLTTLDLSMFNTAKVTDMADMFMGCSTLATIYVSNQFVVSSGAESEDMFNACSALKGAVSYDASKVDAKMASYKTGYFTAKPEAWAEFNSTDSTLTFKYGVKPNSFDDNVTAYAMNVETGSPNIPSYPYWYKCSIKKVVFEESFANARPTTCSNWFSNQENLAEIQGLKYLNTEKVTNMADMFMACASLTSLDLSGFNTENVTDMSDMFLYCMKLKSINLKGFNTANVENMSSMFRECNLLESIDVSGFNTEKVSNMGSMFNGCQLLTTLDLSGFNTEEVTYMTTMFADCKALTSVDLSSFNTENVSLMRSMFNGCEALTTLDISSFNTENASDMYYFFADCSSLKTIYVSDKFSKKTTFTDMFTNCKSLEGAVKFDSNKTSSEMANYKTGYFKTYYRIGDDLTELCGETLSVDKLNLTDGKDFVARAPFTAGTAHYSRSMANNSHWATLCLPYAVDASNVEDCQLYELKNVSSDLITLTQLEGSVAAGTPVLAYFNSINKSSLDVDATNVDVVTAPVDGSKADDYQLVGSFTETEVPDDGYIISKNKFWLTKDLKDNASATAVKTKGLRAWLKSGSESNQAKAHVLGFNFDNEDQTSAIEAIDALTEGKAEIYDIQGHRTDRLQKGLNIVKMGGATKKVMVK